MRTVVVLKRHKPKSKWWDVICECYVLQETKHLLKVRPVYPFLAKSIGERWLPKNGEMWRCEPTKRNEKH